MPKAYEAMRDKFAKGAKKDSPAYDRAQARAASIYNAKHPDAPVTGKHKAKRRGMKGKDCLAALKGGK